MASITSVPGSLRRSRARLRAPLEGLFEQLTAIQVRPTVDRVLADIAASRSGAAGEPASRAGGAAEMRGWTIHRARRAAGSGFVALVGPPSGPAVAIRTATDPRGLAALVREHDALAAILGLELPPSFSRLLPRPVAAGRVRDAGYLAEQALPGDVVDPRRRSSAERAALIESIADAIRPLHAAAGTVRRATPADLETWVDGRVALVWSLIGTEPRDRAAEARLAAVAATLRDSLLDREVRPTRIHGDLWTGNVLVEAPARDAASAAAVAITGIVDWDSSADAEPAFQDLLHLELYTRKLVERESLGRVVAAALAADGAPPAGTTGRPVVPRGLGDVGTLTHREALLLYWLRQVEQNVARRPEVATTARWRHRNVDPVLACL